MQTVFVQFNVDAKTQEEADEMVKRSLQKLRDRGTLRHAFTVQETIQPDGINLDVEGRLLAEWPDTEGTIRVKDEHGNTTELLNRTDEGTDEARWKELRDLMPDDALYFQPDGAGDPDCGTSAANIMSYQVYRDYENAEKAHPDCEILGFVMDEIEGPKFLDVKEPKLHWNKPE